jgi:hypothetical protein
MRVRYRLRRVRYLTGTLATIHNTHQSKTRTRFVIKRRHTTKPQYYKMTLWEYEWVKNLDNATVFHTQSEIDRELVATRMTLYHYYEIIQV